MQDQAPIFEGSGQSSLQRCAITNNVKTYFNVPGCSVTPVPCQAAPHGHARAPLSPTASRVPLGPTASRAPPPREPPPCPAPGAGRARLQGAPRWRHRLRGASSPAQPPGRGAALGTALPSLPPSSRGRWWPPPLPWRSETPDGETAAPSHLPSSSAPWEPPSCPPAARARGARRCCLRMAALERPRQRRWEGKAAGAPRGPLAVPGLEASPLTRRSRAWLPEAITLPAVKNLLLGMTAWLNPGSARLVVLPEVTAFHRSENDDFWAAVSNLPSKICTSDCVIPFLTK